MPGESSNTGGGRTNTPSTTTGATSVEALKELVLQLQMQLEATQRQKVKIALPKAFGGKKEELRGFATSIRAYFLYYPNQFDTEDSQVMFASSRLEGDALAWFEPILRDKIENAPRYWKDATKAAFKSFDGFEDALKEAFGDPDETQSAERQLHQLKQKGPASDYAAKFRQVAAHLEWSDDPLMVAFYQGLRDDVKDELIKEDRPDSLAEYISTAVKIDDRLYERRQEKKKTSGNGWRQFKTNTNAANAKAKRRYPSTSYGHHAGPMEIDLAQKKPGKPKGKCYNCDKEGHFARECRSPKKLDWKPVPGHRQVNIAEIDHDKLTWTACFDDDCATHKEDKAMTGWYPKRPKGKRTINMAFRTPHERSRFHDSPQYQEFQRRELAAQARANDEMDAELTTEEYNNASEAIRRHRRNRLGQRPARDPRAAPRTLHREDDFAANETIDAIRGQYILTEDVHRLAATRQDPETAYSIIISGVQIKEVQLQEHTTRTWFGDDPRMCHESPRHDEISWASCFCNPCLTHLEDKVRNHWFPRRYQERPVMNPYLKNELKYWATRSVVREGPYIILRPDPKYPKHCRWGGTRRECTTVICAYHARGKIEDWHEVGGHDELERLRQMQRQAYHETLGQELIDVRDEIQEGFSDIASTHSEETLTNAGNDQGPL
jgi:hypothetical protein